MATLKKRYAPTLVRRQAARQARILREQADMSLEEAARKLESTRSTLSRLETAETRLSVHLAISMLDVYNIRDDGFLDLVREAAQPGWWLAYGIRDRGYIGMETDALRACVVAPVDIPDLLHIDAYARLVVRAALPDSSRRVWDNHLAALNVRQRRLTHPDRPLRLVAVMAESVLHRPLGGAQVRSAQLRHLAEVASRGTVELRVVPGERENTLRMPCGYTLLDCPDLDDANGTDHPMLYVDFPTGPAPVDDRAETDDARALFERTRSLALSAEESLAFVRELAGYAGRGALCRCCNTSLRNDG